jgi:hypothetical protein
MNPWEAALKNTTDCQSPLSGQNEPMITGTKHAEYKPQSAVTMLKITVHHGIWQ